MPYKIRAPIVYWIHTYNETDPETQGYIGVARSFPERMACHYRESSRGVHTNKNLQKRILAGNFIVTILYASSNYKNCLNREKRLRPRCHIALNKAAGGKGGPTRVGYKMPEDFCQRRREYMLGNTRASGNKNKPKSKEHREKIGGALRGTSHKKWGPEETRRFAASERLKNRNKNLSSEEKFKRSIALTKSWEKRKQNAGSKSVDVQRETSL